MCWEKLVQQSNGFSEEWRTRALIACISWRTDAACLVNKGFFCLQPAAEAAGTPGSRQRKCLHTCSSKCVLVAAVAAGTLIVTMHVRQG
jgi:hypothetical protein